MLAPLIVNVADAPLQIAALLPVTTGAEFTVIAMVLLAVHPLDAVPTIV